MKQGKLITFSQAATICDAPFYAIKAWVEDGKITAFTDATPSAMKTARYKDRKKPRQFILKESLPEGSDLEDLKSKMKKRS